MSNNTSKAAIIVAVIAAAGGGVLVTELVHDEGVVLTPYSDSLGHKTVGVGHLVLPGEKFARLTPEQAGKLLANDIKIAERGLDRIYPGWRKVPKCQQDVLVNLSFNLGSTKLAKFTDYLVAVQLHNWDAAANSLKNSKWCKQVGRRCKRIVDVVRTCVK